MFFGGWLQRREMLSPNKAALVDAINNNQPLTYRAWNQQTNQFANFLRDGLGIRKGDRVSIHAMNRVEYLDAVFACNKLGAILHVVNWMHCVDEALRKSRYTRADFDFLNMVLVKPSAYQEMLQRLGLTEEESVYNADYGHIGEQDSVINVIEGVKQGRLKDGDVMIIVAAGIGYVWGGDLRQVGTV